MWLHGIQEKCFFFMFLPRWGIIASIALNVWSIKASTYKHSRAWLTCPWQNRTHETFSIHELVVNWYDITDSWKLISVVWLAGSVGKSIVSILILEGRIMPDPRSRFIWLVTLAVGDPSYEIWYQKTLLSSQHAMFSNSRNNEDTSAAI